MMIKKILLHLCVLTALILMGGCNAQTLTIKQDKAYTPAFVIVDQREPAFTVFIPLSKDTPAAKLKTIKQKIATDKRAALVPWQTFTKQIKHYADKVIKVNDYPHIDTLDGFTCLLGKQLAKDGAWGLTWNGGIALTYRDFQHTSKAYQKYLKNPAKHKANKDPRSDPIYPNHHLAFAGCQR